MKPLWLLALVSIAFTTACGDFDLGGAGDGDKVRFSAGYAFLRDQEIYVADKTDYQAAKRLTFSGGNSDPFISRDGRTIVYVHTDTAGLSSLRKISSGGGDESDIVPAQAARTLSQPAVSADGSLVVFVANGSAGAGLQVVNADGSNLRSVPQSSYDSSPSFYPGSTSVLALSGANSVLRDQILKVELSAGVRASRLSGLVDVGARAVLSPDGKNIAFEKRDGGRYRIFVVPESGGTPVRLSSTGGDDRSPTWITNTRVGFTSDAGGMSMVYENELGASADDYTATLLGDAEGCSYGGT